MAGMTIGQGGQLPDLKSIFNSAAHHYFKAGEILAADLKAGTLNMDMELPVLEDGVNYDTGAPDVTQVRLTEGTNWSRKAQRGDSDISLQVPSIAGKINDTFLTNVVAVDAAAGIVDGKTYKGAGYSLSPKTVSGSIVSVSEDGDGVLVLPNVKIVASLNAADGDNPAYFDLIITPEKNSEGADIFIFEKTEAVGG